MKTFSNNDILDQDTQFPRIQAERSELLSCPLYSYKINFEGKLYRLHTTCFSNCGSTWFTVRGKKIFVS